MPEFFLELFSEEIPARMQDGARAELARRLGDLLKDAGYGALELETYATPRRLVAAISDLPAAQPDLREERKGPKVGAPEKAIDGFLKSVGMTLDQVEKRDTGKGEVYFAVVERKGRPTTEVLGEIIPSAISAFHWPKSMRWGTGRLRWVRPLHRVVCLLGGIPVPLDLEGIVSGGETTGHRFMAPDPFPVKGLESYRKDLEKAFVVLDGADRKARIDTDARKLCADDGFELVEDAGLLEEVKGLVEWPVALMGRFDDMFLDLPDEVLTSVMRGHQKYFSVHDPKTGRLAPRFVTVSNLAASDGGVRIIEGNQRVLRARLSDARFFWDQDRKVSLESRLPRLEDIVFHAKLGTVAGKVKRVEALAGGLAEPLKADGDLARQAARLAKCDLVADMVFEFPELQGIMGRYYALHDGVPETVADAVRDHYAPLGPGDACPSTPIGQAVSLADKIDTLTGFWLIGEKPTGSKDPFALRRAALGVIRIILEHDLRLNLTDWFAQALAGHRAAGNEEAKKGAEAGSKTLEQDLLAFFADRMKVHLREQGVRHDLIDAVFALENQDDLTLIVARVDALKGFLDTEDGANLLAGGKRAGNILRIEEKKDGESYGGQADEALLAEEAEKSLHKALLAAETEVGTALDEEDFAAAMAALARLRGPVDAFFETVTVNADDPALRRNRLLLLSQIRANLGFVADFTRIEG